MSITQSSSISKIAGDLLQLSQQRQQQIQTHLQVAENTRRARDEAVDQGMAVMTRQSQVVQEVKEAASKMRGGHIDVWA